MGKQKVKPLLTCFTQEGDHLAILSPDGTVKIWSTSTGSLLAEWKQSDANPANSYSSMAFSFIKKKHKKGHGTCLLALGTNEGDIFTIDVLAGDRKWSSIGYYPGGIAGLSFTNKGHSLYVIGSNGKASEMNSENGDLIREFKASKRSISSLSFSQDGKYLALANDKIRVVNLDNGKELLKSPDDLDPVQYISISNDAKTIVTSGFGETNLQLWSCDLSSKTLSGGSLITIPHPPLAFECKNSGSEEGGSVILAVSESGIAYLWNLDTISLDDAKPTKMTVKTDKVVGEQQKSAGSKKSSTPIISARIHASGMDQEVVALIAYGRLDSPKFTLVNVSKAGENVVINAMDQTETIQENGASLLKVDPNGKPNKKRAASDPDLTTTKDTNDTGHGENVDGVLVDDDPDEPTMAEKLTILNSIENGENETTENQERGESSPHGKPPTADSVNVLLKQALHADDRALLLDCLYTQDEKVIANSVSQLNPSDVLKLLRSLVSITQSRGAVLACALPWIKSLLLHHASGIMSQESSILALNSLYQLIESRVSTFESALQISSCLDFLYAGIVEDEVDENGKIPVVFEDTDESEKEESEDAMETDDEEKEDGEASDGVSDFEGIDDMSD
ncbi:periodic tryptophan protein 2-like protein [Hibiscus syriacus]|uniref:Periodic tryptophan protein 2-like protein n=1 Tax=Hibiscus syriacus TaxID=106335 RepID=A0A6A2WLY7_HIBSY|nr:WD repeat-containing protein 43-like [Hibiscus syriacus]KAE8656945.1 periodic tryptophan protein 2-like protein [Hibiscus syriacus]